MLQRRALFSFKTSLTLDGKNVNGAFYHIGGKETFCKKVLESMGRLFPGNRQEPILVFESENELCADATLTLHLGAVLRLSSPYAFAKSLTGTKIRGVLFLQDRHSVPNERWKLLKKEYLSAAAQSDLPELSAFDGFLGATAIPPATNH